MKDNSPNPMVIRYFLFLFLLSILLLGRVLWPFLSTLILSYLLAGIFKPVYSFINRKTSNHFASLLTCLIIILIVFIPLAFFVAALSQEAFVLYQWGKTANLGLKFKELQDIAVLARLKETLGNFGIILEPDSISKTLSDLAKVVGLFLYNQASAWAANILQFLFDFFMMILIIFFLLIDNERLIDYFHRLSPLPDDQERYLMEKFHKTTGAVLIGNGISGLVQGVLGGMVFAFLDLGPPVLWGGVMGVLAFLPIFGIGLVLIPAAIILMLKGGIGTGVFLFIFYIILSFSMEYVLKPKMVGEQVKMHTLLVFLAIMGGLSVFGFLGIIYGPLIVTAFLTLAEIYQTNYQCIKAGNSDLRDS
jgi:predicted PurR-regulated permease PerM